MRSFWGILQQSTSSRQYATTRKAADASELSKSLLEWSRKGGDDVEEQFRIYDIKRQAFSAALQTISAMTPLIKNYSGGDTPNPRDSAVPAAARLQPKSGEKDVNQKFWNSLYMLTRREKYSDKDATLQLQELFDDARNANQRSLYAYTIAISHCVRSNNFKLLRHFALHARMNGVTFDTHLCNTMLGIFMNDRSLPSWSTALRLFASLGVKANTSTWNQLLTLSSSQQKLIVLDHMTSLNVSHDSFTTGILLPTQSEHTSHGFNASSTRYTSWTPSLGDVMIGDLIKRRELFSAISLLETQSFPVSIDGYNQVLSNLRKAPKGKYKWYRLVQRLCQSIYKKQLQPNARTFLLLFQLGNFFSSTGYRDMIFSSARKANLVTAPLWQAQYEHTKLEAARKGRRTQAPSIWEWQDFLTRDLTSKK